MVNVDEILKELVERRGSDLHLKTDRPPLMRLHGELLPTDRPVMSAPDMEGVLKHLLGEQGFKVLSEKWDFDANYFIPGLARFRINALKRMGQFGLVMRVIPLTIPTIDSMGLPPVLKDIVGAPQGMVLVTGPTGSGKSTSLAAMINHVNSMENLHIITVEDPIEFVYEDNKCTINQRQLGTDVAGLKEALRRALRQDPDVILMGEMRDQETIEMAMHAAETGHLVFSTLHTNDSKQTLDRIIDTFPPDAHHQIRAMMALTMHSVISQRLLKRADGAGRVAALEIMICTPYIRELMAQGKTSMIGKEMEKGAAHYRMQTFNQAMCALVNEGVITEEEALSNSANPNDLKLMIKGVTKGGSSVMVTPDKKEAPAPAAAAAPSEETKPGEKQVGKFKVSRGF